MKKYMAPEIEIKNFMTEDIITASGMNTQMNSPNVEDKSTEFDFKTDFE